MLRGQFILVDGRYLIVRMQRLSSAAGGRLGCVRSGAAACQAVVNVLCGSEVDM